MFTLLRGNYHPRIIEYNFEIYIFLALNDYRESTNDGKKIK